MIVSIILLTISIYFLMGMFIQERQDDQLQQELQELIQKKEDEPGENSSGDSFIEVDAGILALHEENPDCIGWLTIEETKIDYPVMYRPGVSAFTTPVYTGNDFNYYSFIKAQKGADYEYFIREIKRKAIYETGITAEYGDKLLTLSTCEYSQRNGRMVVVAKKIQQNES